MQRVAKIKRANTYSFDGLRRLKQHGILLNCGILVMNVEKEMIGE